MSILKKANNPIEFNIFGTIEDNKYWSECLAMINGLPKNIKVTYHGFVKKTNIKKAFGENHVLLFPTENENFGHVIFESLSNGITVIISDKTPWRDLEKKLVGYDISLDNPGFSLKAIKKFVKMNDSEYKKWSNSAINYSKDNSKR